MSEPYNVGNDVSMNRRCVVILPDEQRFAVLQYAAGWAGLVLRLRSSAIAAIGLEATGGYERCVVWALLAAGLSAGPSLRNGRREKTRDPRLRSRVSPESRRAQAGTLVRFSILLAIFPSGGGVV
jgi:transposase